MKRISPLLLLLLVSWKVFSQTVDKISFVEVIEPMVTDSNSVFFYPKLLEKVRDHPDDLTDIDLYYLYYGQIFKIGFEPRSIGDETMFTLEKFMRDGRRKKVVELGTEILHKYPTDLTTLLYVTKCMRGKNSADTIYFFNDRFKMLLSGILSTGNGKSASTAIKIVDVWDESIIKGALGYFGGQESFGQSEDKFCFLNIWDTPKGVIYLDLVLYIKKNE